MTPSLHRRLEVAVRGGDEPHVGLDVLGVADAPDLAHLDRPHELDLQQGRDLGDLVEEQRAALGRGEEARSCWRRRPVNDPFTWPNSSDSIRPSGIAPQLTETNGLSRRWLLKWMARATSSLPVPLSPVIMAVAGLSAIFRMVSKTSTIRGALADDVLEAVLGLELLSEVEVLVAQALALEAVPDDQVDLVELEGLGDVVVGAELHRLDGRLRGGHRRHHDDRGVGREVPGGAQHLQPVDLRHAQVGDDGVEGVPADAPRWPPHRRPPAVTS